MLLTSITRNKLVNILQISISLWTDPFYRTNTNECLSINSSVCSIKFKFEACEKSKPQNTWVFEDLDFKQQRRSWTL